MFCCAKVCKDSSIEESFLKISGPTAMQAQWSTTKPHTDSAVLVWLATSDHGVTGVGKYIIIWSCILPFWSLLLLFSTIIVFILVLFFLTIFPIIIIVCFLLYMIVYVVYDDSISFYIYIYIHMYTLLFLCSLLWCTYMYTHYIPLYCTYIYM